MIVDKDPDEDREKGCPRFGGIDCGSMNNLGVLDWK